MDKPKYDKKALQDGILQIEKNIKRFEEAIEKEQKRKEEFLFYLKLHTEYEKIRINT